MKRAVVLAAALVLLWAAPAFATFKSSAVSSNVISTHQLGTPTLSCGGVGVLGVTFNWTAPADTTQADVYGSGNLATGYELLRGMASGGPYSTTVVSTTATTYTDNPGLGTFYYVVRTTKQLWKGPNSNQRTVLGTILATTCS